LNSYKGSIAFLQVRSLMLTFVKGFRINYQRTKTVSWSLMRRLGCP